MGLLRPRPTARPRKASRRTALVICSSRSIVVRRPETMGVRILVAIMNAVFVSFDSIGEWWTYGNSIQARSFQDQIQQRRQTNRPP